MVSVGNAIRPPFVRILTDELMELLSDSAMMGVCWLVLKHIAILGQVVIFSIRGRPARSGTILHSAEPK